MNHQNTRAAVVTGGLGADLDTVRRYLPAAYFAFMRGERIYIVGNDVAGWTLDGYVLPRLGSGLIAAREIALSELRAASEEEVAQ
jgi:hypothetical protein